MTCELSSTTPILTFRCHSGQSGHQYLKGYKHLMLILSEKKLHVDTFEVLEILT